MENFFESQWNEVWKTFTIHWCVRGIHFHTNVATQKELEDLQKQYENKCAQELPKTLKNENAFAITPRKFNQSFVYLYLASQNIERAQAHRHKEKKDKKGIYFRIGRYIVKANIDENKNILNLNQVAEKKVTVVRKIGRKKIKKEVSVKTLIPMEFYIDLTRTKELKRFARNKKKHTLSTQDAVAEMHKLYSSDFRVPVINILSKEHKEVNLVDAFFVGVPYARLEIDGKFYGATFYKVNVKKLIDEFLKNKSLYKDFLFVNELFLQYQRIFFKESQLMKIVGQLEDYLKNYYKGKQK